MTPAFITALEARDLETELVNALPRALRYDSGKLKGTSARRLFPSHGKSRRRPPRQIHRFLRGLAPGGLPVTLRMRLSRYAIVTSLSWQYDQVARFEHVPWFIMR